MYNSTEKGQEIFEGTTSLTLGTGQYPVLLKHFTKQ